MAEGKVKIIVINALFLMIIFKNNELLDCQYTTLLLSSFIVKNAI
ncbi:hypothetical protein HMPREF0201_03834 [Cedecea davisae DSM 4568]|uniref:Uncharacterized protein n=1 Tax=Cedecea davisae DSM 4568 TaxID=566551 RepID=S3JK78_9ENTR|nr:hypothetical protein HMPREF0201_03834 [Cedecea davisae DSM 4568]